MVKWVDFHGQKISKSRGTKITFWDKQTNQKLVCFTENMKSLFEHHDTYNGGYKIERFHIFLLPGRKRWDNSFYFVRRCNLTNNVIAYGISDTPCSRSSAFNILTFNLQKFKTNECYVYSKQQTI